MVNNKRCIKFKGGSILRPSPVVIYLFWSSSSQIWFCILYRQICGHLVLTNTFYPDKVSFSVEILPWSREKYFLWILVILPKCWQMDMCDVVVRKWLWLPRECTLTLKYGFLQTHTRENKLNRITIFANKNLVGFMVEDGSMQIANIALFVRKFPWQDEFFCKGRKR